MHHCLIKGIHRNRFSYTRIMGFPHSSVSKESACKAGDVRDAGWIPEFWRFPGGRNGNPLQYPCLGNPMDRGASQSTVHTHEESDMTEATKHLHVAHVNGWFYSLLTFHANFSKLWVYKALFQAHTTLAIWCLEQRSLYLFSSVKLLSYKEKID